MTKTKFGWRIPCFPMDASKGSSFVSQITNFAGETEDVFHSMWICDHLIPWASFQSIDTDTLEAWTTACYLSGLFKKPKFGNIVLCNSYRNPALLAKMGATLDVLSNGRFILGIGAGWREEEYKSYGYDFPSHRTRIEQLEEAVKIIKLMWTRDNVTFKGKHYIIENAYCNPKPRPTPPIMIGGGGERFLLRVVAEHADWWNVVPETTEQLKHKIDVLTTHCDSVGRNPNEIKKTTVGIVAIAENDSGVADIVSSSPNFPFEPKFIGTPEEVTEKMTSYVDLGIELFILRFLDFPSTKGARLFAEKVISEL